MSYTVRQLADELRISKPTVRKYLNRLSEQARSGNTTDPDTGTLQISDDCYKAFMELYRVETGAETFPETSRKNGGNTGNDFPETFRKLLEKQVENLENTVEDLRKRSEQQEKHIEQLYKQLETKDKQIEQLSTLISQQQAIHMKQLEVMPDTQSEEPEQKRGLIKRLFRK